MQKKWVFPLLAVSLIVVTFMAATGFSKGKTVATVGGEKITKDELYDVLVKSAGQEALAAMIDDKVVALELKKENISISDEAVDDEIAVYVEDAGGKKEFAGALKQAGMTEAQFRDNIVHYLSIRKVVEPRITITDEEMQAYFDDNKASFDEEEQVEASHILMEDEKTAKEVAKKIADGEDFAALAEQYSTDEASAGNGGELGFFSRGKMVPEFEEKAFSMDIGAISAPVKTDYGYHIIHVTNKKAAKEATFEDHKEAIKELLFEQHMQTEYFNWLDEAKADYDIYNSLLVE